MIEKLKAKGAETLDDIENVFGNTVNYKKAKKLPRNNTCKRLCWIKESI